MGDLLELAARVEAAEGADSELDALVGAARNPYPDARVIYGAGRRFYLKPGKGRIPFHVSGGKGTSFGIMHQSHRYTASIDAAITLLPGRDWEYMLEWEASSGVHDMIARVQIGNPHLHMEAEAATPALALCAAALRARAIEPQSGMKPRPTPNPRMGGA